MKVVCVHSSEVRYMKSHNYTVGKQYDCEIRLEAGEERYVIKNDNEVLRSFNRTRFRECFITLSEIRRDKLNELGI